MTPVKFSRYYLVRNLGAGGMAQTYRAKLFAEHGFVKTLVVKLILPQFAADPRFLSMFIDEAKLAAGLAHGNIVSVFDFGSCGEGREARYFIAMEHVWGRDLATFVRGCQAAGQRVPVDLAVYVASEVSHALAHAHKRRDASGRLVRIVHRDVTPSNILLSFEGEVKLADFGIAKAVTGGHAAAEPGFAGKLAYMAPEQALGEPLDHRSDLFSLGIVLHEALAGQRLFRRPSAHATLQAVVEAPIPRLSEMREDVPVALDDILARALERDPAARYSSADELARDLAALSRNEELEMSSTFLGALMRRVFAKEIESDEKEMREERAFEESFVRGEKPKLGAEVPAAPAPVDEEVTIVGDDAPAVRRKILIVDDAKTIHEVLKVYLLGLDFDFALARNGREGLEVARAERPDLIISDLNMPEMDGIELCRAVRSDPEIGSTPFLFISSRAAPQDRQATREAGADEHLAKPLDADELVHTVKTLTNRSDTV